MKEKYSDGKIKALQTHECITFRTVLCTCTLGGYNMNAACIHVYDGTVKITVVLLNPRGGTQYTPYVLLSTFLSKCMQRYKRFHAVVSRSGAAAVVSRTRHVSGTHKSKFSSLDAM
jgi:hypothetical protein